jgi:type I restriction enzyme S subunit
MKKGWEITKLKEVVDFQRGLTYSKKDEVDFSDNIVLRSNNVDLQKNELDLSDLKYIDPSIKIPENKIVKKGTLIICTANGSKSHLGKIALINEDYHYAFGGFMGLIIPQKQLAPKFLFYLMISDNYKMFINQLSDGANINNLKFSDLGQFEIPIPHLPEQQRIVSILDRCFEAIDKAKSNAERNLQNAKELFESYLNEVFKNKGQNWAERTLGEVCELSAGGDVPKDNFSKTKTSKYQIPVFANGEKNNGLFGFTDIVKVSKPSITVSARGTIGFTVKRLESFFPIVRLVVVTPKNIDELDLTYLEYAVKKIDFKHSGSSIPQLTVPMIREYNFPVPPLKTQQTIVEKLDALNAETKRLQANHKHKLQDLEELKKTVLQKAFQGELNTENIDV